jgi:hypothetical protein
MIDLDLDRARDDPWYVLKVVRGHDPDCAVHPAAWGRLFDEACVGCLALRLEQDG